MKLIRIAGAAARAALAAGLPALLALALAPTAGASVYWGNTAGPVFGLPGTTIGRADNDGTGVDPSFIAGASTPDAVAVDTAHVYWINETDGHSIGRANLDGTGVDQHFITGVDAGSLARTSTGRTSSPATGSGAPTSTAPRSSATSSPARSAT